MRVVPGLVHGLLLDVIVVLDGRFSRLGPSGVVFVGRTAGSLDVVEEPVEDLLAHHRLGDGAAKPRLERLALGGGRIGGDDEDGLALGTHRDGAELARLAGRQEGDGLAVDLDLVRLQEGKALLRGEAATDVVQADQSAADQDLAEALAALHSGDEGAFEVLLLDEALAEEDRAERQASQLVDPRLLAPWCSGSSRRQAKAGLGGRHEAQRGAERCRRELGWLSRRQLRRRGDLLDECDRWRCLPLA